MTRKSVFSPERAQAFASLKIITAVCLGQPVTAKSVKGLARIVLAIFLPDWTTNDTRNPGRIHRAKNAGYREGLAIKQSGATLPRHTNLLLMPQVKPIFLVPPRAGLYNGWGSLQSGY
jgi:hypothetical protein